MLASCEMSCYIKSAAEILHHEFPAKATGKGEWTSEPMICYSRVRFEDTIRIQYWGSNIIGVTALPVMRPVLAVAQGRQVRQSVLCPLLLFLATLREWLSHTIREATVVEGAPFFGSCSVHTAYRSLPS